MLHYTGQVQKQGWRGRHFLVTMPRGTAPGGASSICTLPHFRPISPTFILSHHLSIEPHSIFCRGRHTIEVMETEGELDSTFLASSPAPDFSPSGWRSHAKSLLNSKTIQRRESKAPRHQLRRSISVSIFRLTLVAKHDVAAVFADLLDRTPLPPPGLAQAVLQHAAGTSIDQLWLEFNGRADGDTLWLEAVTRRGASEYVHLICHTGVGQEVRDSALGIALSLKLLPLVKLLLQYGAGVSLASKEHVRDAFSSDDIALAKLLLAAPNEVGVEAWQYCLAGQTDLAPSAFQSCLDRHPDLASPAFLLEAIRSINLRAITTMLSNTRARSDMSRVGVEACRRARLIKDAETKHMVLSMLAQAGLVSDTSFLRSELASAVQSRDVALVKTLSSAGVSLDKGADNGLGIAIAGMHFDMLLLFATGEVPPSLAPSLDYIPNDASEGDILHLFRIFSGLIGQPCDPLHRQLTRAVQFRRQVLAQKLLDCGASVDFQGAEAMKEAVRQSDFDMLRVLLGAKCSPDSLSEIVPIAMLDPVRSMRFKAMKIILEAGRVPAKVLAKALQRVVSDHEQPDEELMLLLLRRKAPMEGALKIVCDLAESQPRALRHIVLVITHFLRHGLDVNVDHGSLLKFAIKHSQLSLLRTVLARGAEVDLRTCQNALKNLSHSLKISLLGHVRDKDVASTVFKQAIATKMSPTETYEVCECLLAKGLESNTVSEALSRHLQTVNDDDLRLATLLLRRGAMVDYGNGVIFSQAVISGRCINTFRLLIKHIKPGDNTTAGIAFLAVQRASLQADQRTDVYRSLSRWKLDGGVVQNTLMNTLKAGKADLSTLQLLLELGADPNRDDGKCFTMTCESKTEPQFKILSSKAQLHMVLSVLMERFSVEAQVVRWLNICLECLAPQTKFAPGHDGLVLICLRRFPKGSALLEIILNRGLSASEKIQHSLSEDWPLEPCTPLLWALSTNTTIDNKLNHVDNTAVCALLDHGGKTALPAYSTPVKGISATFMCLLDTSRTDVLERLLRLENGKLLSSDISAQSLEHLGSSSRAIKAMSGNSQINPALRLDLRNAAVCLGNLPAYQLLSRERSATDGALHMAARLALPDFVKMFLETEDPNALDEDGLNEIPLVHACQAQYVEWCKIGNDRDFRTRKKETMAILAPRTRRVREKTPLHVALDHGPDVTTSMLEILNVASDPDRKKKYQYMDRAGISHSPKHYVTKILNPEPEMKDSLLACLSAAGL
ncbi:hypothetical protein LTR56_009148 [Elasticomyces elasticus]|nr:hypothetical protein LTR56_009148 [Elasticomyces elasticus]KAK3660614.1 hypothetical protein LTR22_007861 [Elasticomyces elasticus]KAK4915583.1 hypothetical protein LTR49_016306 [Elasticomyces elasticus]KAK5755051.1 hypothetical protein LTS12_014851 [Elasticomyces elasticus]